MFQRVLILAPHTDDGEFGCGGTIAKLIDQGSEVYYVAFSAAEKSVPKEFPNSILRQEVKEATQVLGIPPQNLIIFDYEVRDFPLHRQEILEDLVQFQREIKPDLVLLPSLHDIHQDHTTIAREGLRAFKTTSMLGYELPWNNLTFNTTSFVFLENCHVRRKVEALHCYESQRWRRYASEEFIYSLARTRGTQIGAEYAEAFEVIRWIFNGQL
jgi:LmbE family N-acetylglucosaminyl deacetylase